MLVVRRIAYLSRQSALSYQIVHLRTTLGEELGFSRKLTG